MANACIYTDHAPMKLEKHYICWIERRWHIPNKSPFPRLGYRPLSVQCLNLTYDSNNYIDDGFGGSDVGMYASTADRHLDITFKLQLVESSSLVSVLFREAFSHP